VVLTFDGRWHLLQGGNPLNAGHPIGGKVK
jgi:hypothetical protein